MYSSLSQSVTLGTSLEEYLPRNIFFLCSRYFYKNENLKFQKQNFSNLLGKEISKKQFIRSFFTAKHIIASKTHFQWK